MLTAQYYDFYVSRTFIINGGLSTIDFGMPAAIGAKVPARIRTSS
jgi:thiamine pyrophosphate-dependent acetolactate synthase large subunit-like protein